ncbi:hypothetical protein AB4144_11775 [Rhizobiaceae sp. 2RAB30]
MPIVGPASAARNLRAEAGGGRAALRTPTLPMSPIRPGSLVELPVVGEGVSERPRIIAVPLLPEGRPVEQETARTVIRAYQATRDAMLPATSLPVAEAEGSPVAPAPGRVAVREAVERPGAQEEAGEQRHATLISTGMVPTAMASATRHLVGLAAQASVPDRSGADRKAAQNAEPPFREGGWTEAVTLATIIAAICLGVWMLF